MRTVTEKAGECDADLTAFACGDGRIDAEKVVNEIIASYAVAAKPLLGLRVTREFPSGALVGLVGIEEGGVGYQHPLFDMPDWTDPIYISVITLTSQYRGGYVTADGIPLSHVLLRDALVFAASRTGGTIPSMQAVIAPDNRPSRSLFKAHGFEMLPTTPELLYIRPKGLDIPEGQI